MRYFPIFVDLDEQRVVVSGAGETAVAKLRLLLKTDARIAVFGTDPAGQVLRWAEEGALTLIARPVQQGDAENARLFYAANDEPAEDARAAAIGRAAGALVTIVDNLASDFITPAIVDRDPVTVAIGTEGAAPVLARRIKADNEERLSQSLGTLARVAQAQRNAAEAVPAGRPRRALWSRFFDRIGPRALQNGGEDAAHSALAALIEDEAQQRREPGRVGLIGAGPGDPDLLTLKARRMLHEADVVIHDRLVSREVLELGRREALYIEVGKTPDGPSWSQDAINALMIEHASAGAHVARLKSGDPSVYGRLDEEMDALDAAGIAFDIVPGITSAIAAAAEIKTSLTRRHRNSNIRFLTGQDVKGFAEQDWRGLAEPGAVAAIYMGVRAARFLQGRMLMHGAAPDTPIVAVENATRPDQKIVGTTLASLPDALAGAGIGGPAILFLGLAPREAAAQIEHPAIAEAL